MKTAVDEIFEMLYDGKISELAEMKEWFKHKEKVQITSAWKTQFDKVLSNKVQERLANEYYDRYYGE